MYYENKRTAKNLVEAVKSLGELRSAARLEVIPQSHHPLYPILRTRQVNSIPQLIGKQNDGLNTST